MKMTGEQYPKTVKAMQLLIMDNGGLPRDTPVMPDHFEIPDFYARQLPDIERGLAKLSDQDLETFVTGEFDDSRRIGEKHVELYIANTFLETFFESDWPGRHGYPQPEQQSEPAEQGQA